MSQSTEGEELTPDETVEGGDGREKGPALTARAGSDLSAATSVSGVGGENLRMEKPEVGLGPVDEQAEKLGWGQDEDPDAPMSEDLLDDGT